MRCEECHGHEAVYHLMRVTEEGAETLHLCATCAERRGLMTSLGDPPPEGGALEVSELLPQIDALFSVSACSECGMTLAKLQEEWRVGCAACWTTFEAALRVAVRQTQGSTQHVGKGYAGSSAWVPEQAVSERQNRSRLQRYLSEAVAAERFEDAAALRDQLKELDQ